MLWRLQFDWHIGWIVCFFKGHKLYRADRESVAGATFKMWADGCERCWFDEDTMPLEEDCFTLPSLINRFTSRFNI